MTQKNTAPCGKQGAAVSKAGVDAVEDTKTGSRREAQIQFAINIETERRRAPSLSAWRLGDNLVVWCPHCSRYHWHGAPAGHRVAHCRDRTSPYAKTGYLLAEIGPAPRLLISDADHPHPLGPVALRLVPAARRGA